MELSAIIEVIRIKQEVREEMVVIEYSSGFKLSTISSSVPEKSLLA